MLLVQSEDRHRGSTEALLPHLDRGLVFTRTTIHARALDIEVVYFTCETKFQTDQPLGGPRAGGLARSLLKETVRFGFQRAKGLLRSSEPLPDPSPSQSGTLEDEVLPDARYVQIKTTLEKLLSCDLKMSFLCTRRLLSGSNL